MLQFRNGPRPRNYLARREQVRLFVLVTLLMGIVWIALEARNPQRYRWIWAWGQGETQSSDAIDTRVAPRVSPSDDSFVSPAPGEGLEESNLVVSGHPTEADLAKVRDGQYFRSEEQGAWFKLFAELQNTDSATLTRRSIGPVTFIQLYRQPAEYRAELVTISGTLRRSEKIGAPTNRAGIEAYYRTWLFPKDNPANPIIVYTLTVPRGFPEGMTLEEQVELDGFFFKRLPYAATDTVRSAPVVLAKSLRWIASRPKESAPPLSPVAIVALAAAAAGAFASLAWWRTRRARRDKPVAGLFDQLPEGDKTSGQPARLQILTDPEHEGEP